MSKYLWRFRYIILAICLATSGYCAVSEIGPRYHTRPVAVTATSVDVGQRLGAASVEMRSLPEAMIPETALESVPVGHHSALALPAGVALTSAMVAEDNPLQDHSPGWQVIQIPITGSNAVSLTPGTVIDLYANQGSNTETDGSTPAKNVIKLTDDARVISVDAGKTGFVNEQEPVLMAAVREKDITVVLGALDGAPIYAVLSG